MLAIVSLLVVVTLSILMTRIATIALTRTGLSKETARFQARSGITGTGFTTSEAERIVRHPVRRRIIMFLMLVGNAGLITTVSSLVLTFVAREGSGSLYFRLAVLFVGLLVLWTLAASRWVDRHFSNVIDRALRRYTRLEVRDYANLIHLAENYRIVELQVSPTDWLAKKTLAEARLRDEGIVVLGIERANGAYLGVPHGEVCIEPEDTLILYGRESGLDNIDQRRSGWAGDQEHQQAVVTQSTVAQREKKGAS